MLEIPNSVGVGPIMKRKYSQWNPQRVAGTVQKDSDGNEFTTIYAARRWIRVALVRRE